MADGSKIEWCDATFNPWIGCTKISPACDHCYAEAFVAGRMNKPQLWKGERHRTAESTWKQPRAWDRKAVKEGRRARVFCASLADVFDNQVPAEWRADLWALIETTPNLDWLLLTKRPQNIGKMLPPAWGAGWANVSLGTTVENQDEADRRIPALLSVPASVHFLSCEPLLGPLDLTRIAMPQDGGRVRSALDGHEIAGMVGNCVGWIPPLDWVICGGESGPGARPMHPDWARSLRDQCAAAGVAFMFKQWGDLLPDDQFSSGHPYGSHLGKTPAASVQGMAFWRVGKVSAGRLLDGRTHHAWPGASTPAAATSQATA